MEVLEVELNYPKGVVHSKDKSVGIDESNEISDRDSRKVIERTLRCPKR